MPYPVQSATRILLVRLIPATLLCLLVSGLFCYVKWSDHLQALQAQEQLSLAASSREMMRVIQHRSKELFSLSRLSSLQAFLNASTAEHHAALVSDFSSFVQTSKLHDQLRYLDATGQEVIRINLASDGARLVPAAELQNKRDRYYFNDTIKLNKGQLYISEFDLNIEQGKLDLPHKPMIRLGTPIFDHQGRKRGVLILNYLGQDLLTRMTASEEGKKPHLSLVNDSGYWLHAPDPTLAWGFMLKRPELTMSTRYPEAWQRMAPKEHGQFRNQQGLWTFATITPLDVAEHGLTTRHHTWKLISQISTAELQQEFIEIITPIALVTLLVLALIIAAVYRLSQALHWRQLKEQEVRDQLRKIELLLNSTMEGIYAVDRSGHCIMANRSCAELLGYDRPADLLGKQMHELVHHTRTDGSPYPLAECKAHNIIETGTPAYVNDELLWRKDGSSFPVAYTAHPIEQDQQIIGMVCTFVDQTEQKQAEAQMAILTDQLRQAQKMEAIGQLASGVAHDFNNILQVISGNAQLLQLTSESEHDPIQHRLAEIVKAVERGVNLTRAMLAFARRQTIALRPIELNQLLLETEPLAHNLLYKKQQLSLQLCPQPLLVTADATLIQQVVFNLITNARDAMPEGGNVTIGTGRIDVAPEQIDVSSQQAAGPFAIFWVQDTGLGISAEIRDKIFEPFFTTKEVGKGTGLGLAMIYGTIKQHNGFVRIESEPGHGSTVSVYLPCQPETAAIG